MKFICLFIYEGRYIKTQGEIYWVSSLPLSHNCQNETPLIELKTKIQYR